jgi:hypothetical protein
MKTGKFLYVFILLILLAPTLQGCAVIEVIIRALGRAGVTVPASDATPPTVTLEVTGLDRGYLLGPGDPPLRGDVRYDDRLNFKAVARDEDGGVAYVAVEGELNTSCAGPDDLGRNQNFLIRKDFRDDSRPGDTALVIRQVAYSLSLPDRIAVACPEGWTLLSYSGYLYAVGENFSHTRISTSPFSFQINFTTSAPIVAASPTAAKATPTLISILTDTPTPFHTDTPTAQPLTLMLTQNAFCRKGPGTIYPDVTAFEAGQQLQVDGQNDFSPRWWWVRVPNSTLHCWVSDAAVQTSGPVEQAPVQPAPPTPTFTPPPNSGPACSNITSDSQCNNTPGCSFDYNAKQCVKK